MVIAISIAYSAAYFLVSSYIGVRILQVCICSILRNLFASIGTILHLDLLLLLTDQESDQHFPELYSVALYKMEIRDMVRLFSFVKVNISITGSPSQNALF